MSLVQKFSGKNADLSLENKIFNLASLIGFVTAALNAITEMLFGLPPFYYLFALVMTFAFLLMYILNYHYNDYLKFSWMMVVAGNAVIIYDWYTMSGLVGVSSLFILTFMILYTILLKGKTRIVSIVLLLLITTCLYVIERADPTITQKFNQYNYQIVDIYSTTMMLCIALPAIMYVILSNYQKERKIAAAANNDLEIKNSELNKALSEIKTLQGFLPICSSCKKIRDVRGYWNKLETYIEKHSDAKFSHGICDDCVEKLYGKEYRDEVNNTDEDE